MIPTLDLKKQLRIESEFDSHLEAWCYMMICDDFWWFLLFMMLCDALWLIRMIYDELCDLLILNGDFTKVR